MENKAVEYIQQSNAQFFRVTELLRETSLVKITVHQYNNGVQRLEHERQD